jgi:hypothetical protein
MAGIGCAAARVRSCMRGDRARSPVVVATVARRAVVAMLLRCDGGGRRWRRLRHRHVHHRPCQDLAEQSEEHDETAVSEAKHDTRLAASCPSEQMRPPSAARPAAHYKCSLGYVGCSIPGPTAHSEDTVMAHESMQTCIDACNACAIACDHCASACLAEQDVQKLTRCIALDIDCAEICRASVALMSRGSELASVQCEACIEACERCAEECEKHPMQHCRDCARVCRRCADECRRMLSSMPAHGRSTGAGAAAH